MEDYEVAICQCEKWDWQMSIEFHFNSLDEMVSFVKLCLEQDLLVQIKKHEQE